MKRGLLGRCWEGPDGLGAALLTEFKAHLARWPQPFGVIGAEGHAGLVELQSAKHAGTEEAVVA